MTEQPQDPPQPADAAPADAGTSAPGSPVEAAEEQGTTTRGASTPARTARGTGTRRPAARRTTAQKTAAGAATSEEPTTATSTTAARRTPTRTRAAKTTGTRSAAAKTTAAKSAAAKSPVAKSPVAKSPAAKSTVAKSPAAKSTAAKSPAAKSGAAKRAAGKRSAAAASAGGPGFPQAVAVASSARRFARKAGPVVHPTPQERAARGRTARDEVPRAALGLFDPLPSRLDPVDLLESQAVSRVRSLVPIRYGRMLTSPFAFYRGAALIMASDLASQPRTALVTQLCGDAHLSNFGSYASPERRMVFDINDFDETNPGPFEWDVKRMVTSFEVAARERGFADADRAMINLNAAMAYRVSLVQMAAQGNLQVWYDHLEMDTLLAALSAHVSKKVARQAERNVAKARTRDSMQAFQKLTKVVDGERRIISQPPLIVAARDIDSTVDEEQLVSAVRGMLREYRATLQSDRRHLLEQFEYVDLARKVVGVGSVGTRCWIVLMSGRDANDPLFLQVKEAQSSVLEAYTGRSEYRHMGERVVAGQRLMQAASDIFLGWIRNKVADGGTRDFYVRQLRDGKGSAVIETMDPNAMTLYAKLCGAALAKAHARSGDRIALAAYMGGNALDRPNSFDRAMAAFAVSYADQNERDYAALRAAVDAGRVTAEFGL